MMLAIDFGARVALVTGAASGIGARTADLLAEHGARVVAADLNPRGISREGCMDLSIDVRDARSVRAARAAIIEEFGESPALIVQSAGITRDHVLWKMTDDDWKDVLDTNLTGAFNVLREFCPDLRDRGGGSVVNVASINGLRGKFGQANYTAAKAGLIGLTRTAARELGAFGVRVNAVAPGMVRTPMTVNLPQDVLSDSVERSALKRISEPEDVAAVIAFLLSDLARQITGEVIRVDGGRLA